MGNGSMAGNVTGVNRVNNYKAHLEVIYMNTGTYHRKSGKTFMSKLSKVDRQPRFK